MKGVVAKVPIALGAEVLPYPNLGVRKALLVHAHTAK